MRSDVCPIFRTAGCTIASDRDALRETKGNYLTQLFNITDISQIKRTKPVNHIARSTLPLQKSYR